MIAEDPLYPDSGGDAPVIDKKQPFEVSSESKRPDVSLRATQIDNVLGRLQMAHIILKVSAAAFALMLSASCEPGFHDRRYGDHMMPYGYGGIGMWILLVILLVIFVYMFTRSRSNERRKEDPLDILKRRYAGGEISKEEFEQMKKDIGKRED
ncbi:MAG: SHOCT domain-containing protein [Desulfobacterales bacterium]